MDDEGFPYVNVWEQTNIGEFVEAALEDHPDLEKIQRLLEAGAVGQIRVLEEPNEAGDKQFEAFLEKDGDAVSIFTLPVSALRRIDLPDAGEQPWVRVEHPREPRSNVTELVAEAILIHPLRDWIQALLEAGHKVQGREMVEDPDEPPVVEEGGDLYVRIPKLQAYITDGEEFISIVSIPLTAIGFKADAQDDPPNVVDD